MTPYLMLNYYKKTRHLILEGTIHYYAIRYKYKPYIFQYRKF
jgi:hypothetical protein